MLYDLEEIIIELIIQKYDIKKCYMNWKKPNGNNTSKVIENDVLWVQKYRYI